VTLTCLACTPISIGVLRTRAGLPWPEVWRLLGWWPVDGWDVGRALLLTATLFAGPLYEKAVANGGVKQWVTGVPLRETLGSWIGVRNYVMVSEAVTA
jgi:prenyl protein peptidase